MNILERIKQQIVYFDGGMGSLLQERGLQPGELPELWNLSRPEDIIDIHRKYLDAGSHIILSNTFGANSLKYTGKDGMPTLDAVVEAALKNVKTAIALSGREDAYAALDIGSCGKMLEPLGDYPFEDAVQLFAEIVDAGAKYGADLIVIETMNDSYETKAAVLAAKERSDLPVFVTNVYDEQAKLMTGANPEAMVAMLEGLHVDAIGMNCSLGPAQMKGIVPRLVEAASVPVIVNPNAGLPRRENGQTVYDVDAEEFAQHMVDIVSAGAMIVGGCCGTTPEYIAQTVAATKDIPFRLNPEKNRSVISSYTHAVEFGTRPILIGERINPTGKKKFQQALRDHNIDYILEEGIRQQEAGVDVLDVNVGLPEIDEDAFMCESVFELQSVVDLPLQIDTTDATVMEHALRLYNGKAMINSVNGKQEEMKKIFPLVAKYGGLVVGLTLDEDGIPTTAEARVEIAKKIYDTAATYGIAKKDIIIDPLAMTISADDQSGKVTLDAVEKITRELDGLTSLGVSNISFGLPKRNLINGTFFTMAMQNGLKAAIMNPFSREMMQAYKGFLALSGLDENCMEFIDYVNSLPEETVVAAANAPKEAAAKPGTAPDDQPLQKAIVKGLKERAGSLTKEMIAAGADPLVLVNEQVVPALDLVGQGFEAKTMFLPQLLIAADAAKASFDVIKEKIAEQGSGEPGEKVIVATVKGDIHDIGKNIVRVLLENYGFDVIDLGKDVPPEEIVERTVADHIELVGLSALMTTTVPSMEETIRQLNEAAPWCKTVVGGAVLTQEYADMIHADHYAKDAMETVRYAEEVLKK